MRVTNLLSQSKVLYSGIQPTGVLHLGNYFGAVRNWLHWQNETDVQLYVNIADLHSISTGLHSHNAGAAHGNIMSMAACGIHPERSTLFLQSDVPEHAQLAWIIGTTCTLAQLQRFGQYKDKSKAYAKQGNVPLGLLTYPVLQAADILLYDASHVPVGRDQTQHLELAATLARNMNRLGDNGDGDDNGDDGDGEQLMKVPRPVSWPWLFTPHSRIRSLRQADKKMSKSDVDGRSRIELSDNEQLITHKCRRALTDSIPHISYEPEQRAAVSNLVHLLSAVEGVTEQHVVAECSQMDTVQFKTHLAQRINELVQPIRIKYEQLMANQQHLRDVLLFGAQKAQPIATHNMQRVRHAVGLTTDFINNKK